MSKDQAKTKGQGEGQNLTEPDVLAMQQKAASDELGAQNGAVATPEQKEQQERTKIKKKLFIEFFIKGKGIVSHACAKADISRETYYVWREQDQEFAKALTKALDHEIEDVRDVLKELVFIKKHPPSVQFYLERRDALFKQKSITEVIVGDRTLEDVIAEDEEELNKQNDTTDEKTAVESGADPRDPEDQGQAQGAAEVQAELGTSPVLGEENAPQPDPQGPAEGNQ